MSDLQLVLNAFRHHRVAEDACTAGTHAPAGAQRLSASPRRRGRSAALGLAHEGVLNAFRHHRVAEGSKRLRAGYPARCSTPFGITASPRLRSSPPLRGPSRAQRLSASPRRRGLRLLQALSKGTVLNAFRHHRVAEVINIPPGMSKSLCSTPFGITASPRRAWARRRRPRAVLNAFRHHRVAEATRARRAARPPRRAQRLSASPRRRGMEVSTIASPLVCSTPFGITASPRDRLDRWPCL